MIEKILAQKLVPNVPVRLAHFEGDTDIRELAKKTENEFRTKRIKRIYGDVLSKAGDKVANDLCKQYFPIIFRTVDFAEFAEEMKEKRRREKFKIVDGMTFLEKAPAKGKKVKKREHKSPSSAEKRQIIKQYGRWYLQPKEFGYGLKNISKK